MKGQADAQGLPYPDALSALAQVRLAAARGSTEAPELLETALHLFAQLELPLETARLQLEVASSWAGSNPRAAVAEARRPLVTFESLGAERDADSAAALLRSLGEPGRTGP